MKAVGFIDTGGAEVLHALELPRPVPAAHEAVVRTFAVGVNFADIYRRRGEYAVVPPSPYVLGYEGAGVVEEIGAQVRNVKVGDRVAFANVPRANAEFVSAPKTSLVRIPESVSFEQASGILLQGLTAHYLTHDSHALKQGETILVHSGASGVGLLLLQYSRRIGAHAIAVVSSDAKAEMALKAGASEVIVTEASKPDWKSRAGRRAIDVVYDAVGSTLGDSLEVVRSRGKVVFYGWAGGLPALVDPRVLMSESKTLVGGDLWSYVGEASELKRRSEKVFGDLAAGVLELRIDRRFGLADAADAHRYLESRKSMGKVLLIP